jgi:uncharacterized protein (DUF1684 family)
MTSAAAPSAVNRERLRFDRYRKSRHEALAAGFGWLTLTSLQWLGTEPTAVEFVPGLWSANAAASAGGIATLTAKAADNLVFADTGEPVDGSVTVRLANEESLNWVRSGNIVVELAVRADRYAIRTRDLNSPVYTGFNGVPTFEFDPDLVVTGHFTAYDDERQVPVDTSHPQVQSMATAVGEVSFELGGTGHRLVAEPGTLGGLTLNFHDLTNGTSTYDWRKVTTAKPRPDGTVIIDFNRAINYPSAFTPYGTCPRPIRGNRIDALVEAGEKLPQL